MTGLENEYERFMAHLREKDVSADACRLANLIRANLHELATHGAARRARSTRLAPLAVRLVPSTSHELAPLTSNSGSPINQLRLHELVVGPFRGFSSPETFNLSHDLTLVYGANGTGKSSFCEALELAMLGFIREAESKRLDLRDYCNNVVIGHHARPMLSAKAVDGSIERIDANESRYRFCFVEKNRLDDFGRIAARTPADQRQLIATLFGIDEFSEFVRGFNQSLDDSLELVGPMSIRLARARETLATADQTVAAFSDRMWARREEEAALAETILPGHDYESAQNWLLGVPGSLGRLRTVQAQLDAPSQAILGHSVDWLSQLLVAREDAMAEQAEASKNLAARAGEVSYLRLYAAIIELTEGQACPACGTDLAIVRHNPFDQARTELRDLVDLADLQHREYDTQQVLSEATRALWAGMCEVVSSLQDAFPAEFEQARLPLLPDSHVGEWLSQWSVGEQSTWGSLVALVGLMQQRDDASASAMAERPQLILERDQLDGYRTAVERLRTVAQQIQNGFDAANLTIKQFEDDNRELILAAESERSATELNQRIKAAYDELIPALQGYLSALPAQLIQGLATEARALYNAFNRGDHDSEKLIGLWLPVTENEKIEIEFLGKPGVKYDALVVLSEGHIRCLGLAILLAKNIEQRCPVVVFDDVVNAIDDEHRDGIWRTFFEGGRLNNKQVILTSHAEEFLNRIQQELGAVRAGDIRRYKFMPRDGTHELRVDADPPIKNYVLLARQALDADEKRDGLRHARPAIESLTDQLWTWMGKRGNGRLDITLSGPRAQWELNNKCTKLRGGLKRILAQNPDVAHVVVALDALLGVNGTSIEWGYLNSGTHDSRRDHEFDRATVRTIVEAAEMLDQTIVRLRNG